MSRPFEFLGRVKTVGELVELLRENCVDEDARVFASGAFCHVILKHNGRGKVTNIIFDDDDYSEEWNEEIENRKG